MPPRVKDKADVEPVVKADVEPVVNADVEPVVPESRLSLVSSIYMVNPYTKVVYYPGETTVDVKPCSWTQCQLDAGLLKEVK